MDSFFFSTCEGRNFLENCQHICYCIFNMQQQKANFQWSVTLSVTHLCDRSSVQYSVRHREAVAQNCTK